MKILRERLTPLLPGAVFALDAPMEDGLAWWLDITYQGRCATILLRPWLTTRFGLYIPKPPEEIGYGELPDEHHESLEQTVVRVVEVLKEVVIR